MEFLRRLYDRYFGHTMKELVDNAIAESAKLRAEAEKLRVRANHYTVMVTSIDPMRDHWSFAHARDEQLIAQNAHAVAEAAAAEADRLAQEMIAKVVQPEFAVS
jgi:hypothetical protein